jgi:hypothetical protein
LQRSALPSFLGFVLGLILSLAGPLVWAILPQAMTGKSAAEMTALFAVVGFVQSLCWAAVLASLGLDSARARTGTTTYAVSRHGETAGRASPPDFGRQDDCG